MDSYLKRMYVGIDHLCIEKDQNIYNLPKIYLDTEIQLFG